MWYVTLTESLFKISHTNTAWDNTKAYWNRQLQLAALPCKLHDDSQLDCSKRSLNQVPSLPATQITTISFNNNNFTTIPPSSFAKHPELLRLDFTYGNIDDLHPHAFLGTRNLITLILAQNRIATLPDHLFRGLSNLQVLDLSLNYLHIFPSEALEPLLSLAELNLLGNQITTFPPSMINMKPPNHLRKLLMTSQTTNIYTSDGGDISPPIFLRKDHVHYFTYLERFEWLFNTFEEVQSDMFSPLKNLKTLMIHCSGYDAVGPVNRTLTTLLLSCFPYEDALTDFAPNGTLDALKLKRLKHFPHLSTLSLHLSLVSISNGSFVWIPSLRKLDLNGNSLQYLSAHAFDGLQLLEELDLSFNSFTSVPSDALRVFQHSSNLNILNLANNKLNMITNVTGDHSGPFGSSERLEELVLSNNNIVSIPANAFASLPVLRVLDLSGNKLSGTETWLPPPRLEKLFLDDIDNDDTGGVHQWQSPVTTLKVLNLRGVSHYSLYGLYSKAPNLMNLTFTGSSIPSFSFLKHCDQLRMLDLSENKIDSDSDFYNVYIDEDEGWMGLNLSKLEVLIISSNKLSYLLEGTFETSPLLIKLDISDNLLTNIHSQVFTPLKHLKMIDMSRNKIVSLEPLLNLPSAKFISISHNKIVSIPTNFLPKPGISSLEILDLSGNPLQCSCDAKSFQDWIFNDTKVFLKFYPGFYDCAVPKEWKGVVITAVPLDCNSRLGTYLSIGVVIFIFCCFFIFMMFKCRWHISYKLFLLFKRSKQDSYIDDETLVESCSNSITSSGNDLYFDAYIACSKHDEDWVFNELRPQLEDTENPVKLFIGARDFPLGQCILDCIVDGIQKSRKTVLILSPRFVEDEWCYFEMQMAQQRLFQDGRDVLIMVLYKEIQSEKLTMLLRHMLCQKDYLKWPTDKLGQELFRERLKEEMRRPSKVDRINQM